MSAFFFHSKSWGYRQQLRPGDWGPARPLAQEGNTTLELLCRPAPSCWTACPRTLDECQLPGHQWIQSGESRQWTVPLFWNLSFLLWQMSFGWAWRIHLKCIEDLEYCLVNVVVGSHRITCQVYLFVFHQACLFFRPLFDEGQQWTPTDADAQARTTSDTDAQANRCCGSGA